MELFRECLRCLLPYINSWIYSKKKDIGSSFSHSHVLDAAAVLLNFELARLLILKNHNAHRFDPIIRQALYIALI